MRARAAGGRVGVGDSGHRGLQRRMPEGSRRPRGAWARRGGTAAAPCRQRGAVRAGRVRRAVDAGSKVQTGAMPHTPSMRRSHRTHGLGSAWTCEILGKDGLVCRKGCARSSGMSAGQDGRRPEIGSSRAIGAVASGVVKPALFRSRIPQAAGAAPGEVPATGWAVPEAGASPPARRPPEGPKSR